MGKLFNFNNLDDQLQFLNLHFDELFRYKHHIATVPSTAISMLKCDFQICLTDIERCFRGSFMCDLFCKYGNPEKLKQMYPNVCANIFDVDNNLKMMGRYLEWLRNICSHPVLCRRDFKLFNSDFSFLESHPKMNPNLKYYDNGITIAGVIYIVGNFLNEKSLKQIMTTNYLFSLVYCGEARYDDGVEFVKKVSHVNLNVPIRSEIGEDILTSVVGELRQIYTMSDNGWNIYGGDENPVLKIVCRFDDNQLTIAKGSRGRIVYDSNYNLAIKEKELFIELSNKLPPFALVDYLYIAKVYVFTKDVYQVIMAKFNKLVYKLNFSKFYIDKNIYTLFLDETISDFTYISILLMDSLERVLFSFEDSLYSLEQKKAGFSLPSKFSTSLKIMGLNKDLITKVSNLRAGVAHGVLINEIPYNSEYRLTLPFIMNTLCELVSEVQKTDENQSSYLKHLINIYLIKRILSFKFNSISTISFRLLLDYPNCNYKELIAKNLFNERSCFSLELLKPLFEIVESKDKILELELPGATTSLFFLKKFQRRALFIMKKRQFKYSTIKEGIIEKMRVLE